MNQIFHETKTLSRPGLRTLAAVLGLTLTANAHAFCGFYVAKADTKLFNKASQVVLARQNNATVLTMVSDYDGDPSEFALVVPVPTFLEREQIHVTEKKVIDHLDAYTSPRLVEYFDPDPCMMLKYKSTDAAAPAARADAGKDERARSLGVTIEASYTVGEYDILILSAKESDGLESWLNENGYKIPAGATDVIGSYLKQKMRFFVAKVNLGEKAKLGVKTLRPLQIAFESPKFMLPIRLGTVNADGPQELFVYALTTRGRVETTNYRTVKLPSDVEVPLYVRGEFGAFYKAMFDTQVRKEDMRVVFQEYAWDMGWCDPCAADPLSASELRELGVFWQNNAAASPSPRGRVAPAAAQNVFVTRLHLRYDREHFPEDLVFQETGDRTNFQGRYILRQPWAGQADCDAAREYRRALAKRQREEARNLANLTGWDLDQIARKMDLAAVEAAAESGQEPKFWRKLWGDK
jgi:hypothetical protein